MMDDLHNMAADPIYSKYGYLTYNDILRASPEKAMESGTLMAVLAP
jgi:hypothetical protein